MTDMRLKPALLLIGAILLIVCGLISVLWAIQAAWLSAADPRYEDIYQLRFWIRAFLSIIFFGLAAIVIRRVYIKK